MIRRNYHHMGRPGLLGPPRTFGTDVRSEMCCRDDHGDAARDMVQHGVEYQFALGVGQHELLGEVGEDAEHLRTGIDHAVDGALLAIEIEPAVAVEHRRHDGEYALVGPLNDAVCHDHAPFALQPAAPWRRRPLQITSLIAAAAASASPSAIAS